MIIELQKQIHKELLNLCYSKGKAFRKRHGNWIRVSLLNNYFLQLDSCNSCIQLKKGSGLYCYWTGFEGDLISTIGGDFGGFYSKLTLDEWFQVRDIIYKQDKFQIIKR